MLDGCIPKVSYEFVQYLVQNELPIYADDHHAFYKIGGNIIAVTMGEVMEHYEEIFLSEPLDGSS